MPDDAGASELGAAPTVKATSLPGVAAVPSRPLSMANAKGADWAPGAERAPSELDSTAALLRVVIVLLSKRRTK